jgi:hypothetical protein
MRTNTRLLASCGLAALAASLAACSDWAGGTDAEVGIDAAAEEVVKPDTTPDPSPEAAPDAEPDVAPDVAPDNASDAPVDPDVPILERAPRVTHACEETLPPTATEPHDWYAGGLVGDGSQAWVARVAMKVGVSTVATDGSLGTLTELASSDGGAMGPVLAAQGGRLAAAWLEWLPAGGQALRVAFAKDGVATAPKTVPGSQADTLSPPAVAPAEGGGVAVFWADQQGSSARQRFARLDDKGDLAAGPVTITAPGDESADAQRAIVPWKDGFAAVWTRTSWSTGATTSDVVLVRLDPDGNVLEGPRRVSREPGPGETAGLPLRRTGTPLLAIGDRLWLAYQLAWFDNDFSNSKGWTVVELVEVEAAGQETVHRLQAPIENVNATDATLYSLGGKLGVTWAAGTAIYICGGCYVDYDLKSVLLDPDGPVPASAPVTHTHSDHGYAGPGTVVLGADLLTVAAQDFHAISIPSVAVIRCTPAP